MQRIFSWALNALYLTVITLALPWILWSAMKHGKYREGFAAKLLGKVPKRRGSRPCVWFHAVSVGEVNLIGCVLDVLKQSRPDWELVISTTTKTGYELAKKKYAEHTVFYCPLDFSWAVRCAMQRVRPNLLVLAELELWPNLIQAAGVQGAKVAIVNGRLSDGSTKGYSRIKPLVSRVLQQIDLIAAQNDETAERFLQLGANPSSVVTTGSLKFDGAEMNRENPRTEALAELAGLEPDDIVLLAGSTQEPEEAYAIEIFQELLTVSPRLKLLLVPRHPQRFDEVAGLLERSGIPWIRRTELENSASTDSPSAILIDSIGELGAWWGTATIGFVGGSFGSRGGQNMLEPAAYGVATCFGPNTKNFRDIVAQLLAVEGAQVVQDQQQLAEFVRQALTNPSQAASMGRRAQQLVLQQQGATERTLELLLPLVEGSAASDSKHAA